MPKDIMQKRKISRHRKLFPWIIKRIKPLLMTTLKVYVILTIVAYFITPLVLFQPPAATKTYDPNEFTIKNQSHSISAVYLQDNKNRYTILYSHGNAADLHQLKPWIVNLYQHGYNVLAYDYDGYGHSQGRTSENNCYADSTLAYNYLIKTKHIQPRDIILMGHSMGTGVTTKLAAQVSVGGVILQSPMLSIYRIITHFPLFYPDYFPSYRYINKIHAPILIIHGTADQNIPFYHGKKLYHLANQPKTFISVQGAGHNNISSVLGGKYFEIIRKFTNNLEIISKR